mmetsp:Transcript_105388/g.263743  ORF Transcript_105388/g.263743 Transcript_105388/m.263743 type:complete len:227 (-) Transcript_105388:319-999(-)
MAFNLRQPSKGPSMTFFAYNSFCRRLLGPLDAPSLPSGQIIKRKSSKPAAVNGEETRALPMQPRNLVERWPMRHSARTHDAPSTSPSATVTPSSCPASISENETSDGMEKFEGRPMDDSSCEEVVSTLITAGESPQESLASDPEETDDTMGNDFDLAGRLIGSSAASPSTLRRNDLCSSLSLRTSSSAPFFQFSSSVTLFCRPARLYCRYCTHCAREAACFAATSA